MISDRVPGVIKMNWRPMDRRAAIIWKQESVIKYWGDSNMRKTYKHVNGHSAIDMVHVHITEELVSKGRERKHCVESYVQFIKTPNRRTHGFPEGKQQADL